MVHSILMYIYLPYTPISSASLNLHCNGLGWFQDAAQTAGGAAQLTFGHGTRHQTLLVIPLGEYPFVQVHEHCVH